MERSAHMRALSVALCFTGQARTFTNRLVLHGHRRWLIAPHGEAAISFFYLTRDDAGSSYGSHTPRRW